MSELSSKIACRLCGGQDFTSVLDLGASPPCERILTEAQLDEPEPTYPLHLRMCRHCRLCQIPALIDPTETFGEYAYFSSYSTSWVEHAAGYVAQVTDQLGLSERSFVVEVASNDGYLLRNFVSRGIPCLGIEPSENVGEAARAIGVPTVSEFLGERVGAAVAAAHGQADLVVANNVYAHIPEVVDFTKGLAALVKEEGWITIEVQYLRTLVERCQFDTIYHEHFQYYTLASARTALASGGLQLIDAEFLATHGGSLRLWVSKPEAGRGPTRRLAEMISAEEEWDRDADRHYRTFRAEVATVRRDLLRFLIDAAERGERVVGYGAPGKGNTLLNYCGVRPDLVSYTVDRNPYKHGKFTPGARLPILAPEHLAEDQPDYILILPWNLREELTRQLAYVGEWGGRLVFPIPKLEIVEPGESA